MAQNTVLAAAQTAADSSNITVAAGQTVTVGLFAASKIPAPVRCAIHIDGPTGDQIVGVLTGINHTTVLSGPGTFFVRRPVISAYGVSVGVMTET